MRPPAPLAATLLLAAGAAAGQTLANPGFEEQGSPPPGWSLSSGAGDPSGRPSSVECDAQGPFEKKRALKLLGDAETASWQYVAQRLAARPGDRWTLRFAVKCEEVRREGQQRENAYVRLVFHDAGGKQLAQELANVAGTRGWCESVLQAVVPGGAATGEVAIFLSMSGALWADDLRLDVAPTAPFDEKDVREAAFDAVEGHLRRTYPFFGLAGKPMPDELFKGYRLKAVKEKELKDFAGVLKKMLDELDDLHVALRLEGERISTGPSGNPNPQNWNLAAVDEHVAEVVSKGGTHLVARLKENVGYVRLASFSAEWDELKQADAAMDRLNGVKGWILDVRPNGGGGEDKGEYFAGRFVGEKVPYAHHVFRDAFAPDDPAAFTEVRTRWLNPREDCVPDPRPLAVLMGPYCVSSTEGFLAMMAAVPKATLVGRPSRGASANPATLMVVPGLELVSSRWRSLTLADECIEGVGLQPDVLVDAREPEYLKGDPTLESALELFR